MIGNNYTFFNCTVYYFVSFIMLPSSLSDVINVSTLLLWLVGDIVNKLIALLYYLYCTTHLYSPCYMPVPLLLLSLFRYGCLGITMHCRSACVVVQLMLYFLPSIACVVKYLYTFYGTRYTIVANYRVYKWQ